MRRSAGLQPAEVPHNAESMTWIRVVVPSFVAKVLVTIAAYLPSSVAMAPAVANWDSSHAVVRSVQKKNGPARMPM
nr:hypothetical protein [Kibdelosporangium sp. MJ126-NF4]